MYLAVEEIKPYKNNPRINKKAVKVVADSIKEYGFKNPIVVDKDKVIIVGHTRLEASKVLGLEKVPVIIAEDLSEDQVKGFRIMDNKSSEFAEWDYSKLLDEIEDLRGNDFDIDLTGFSEEELEIKAEDFLEEEEEEDKPEMEFSEELLEEHQYVVLYFDNTLDWQVAREVLGIKSVHMADSREGYERKGIGRIIKGNKVIEEIKEARESGK